MQCKVTLSLLLFLIYLVNRAESNKSKNDKFLDYGAAQVEFVPIDETGFNHFNSLFNSNYPLIKSIKSKSLNMTQTDPLIMEKKKQKEIVTRLIDSINFDAAGDHAAGKVISADQLPPIGHKHQKINLNTLSTYRLEFLGLKSQEKYDFNHYIIIKKRVKKSSDYAANRNGNRNNHLNNLNIDNSLFYTYQNTPLFVGHTLFNRNASKRNYTALYQQSKSLSDPNHQGQFVFCSVFVQKNINFGRKAIRIAFYQSLKSNLNEISSANALPPSRVHNVWLTSGTHSFTTLKPIERINTLSGLGMLYKTV